MLKDRPPTQSQLEFVSIDELVPQDHLLRKIDAKIDFAFIHDVVKPYYCEDNGRPALDPTLMSKLLLIGHSLFKRPPIYIERQYRTKTL